MSIFKNKNFTIKEAANESLLKSLDKKQIRYVSKREPDGETIIGRNGCLNVADGELIIVCNNEDVFRGKLENISAAFLMSLDGVVLTHKTETEECTYVAYYKYYR